MGSVQNLDEYRISLNTNIILDQRVYNAPTASQVAAIWVEGNNPQNIFDRSVVVYGREERPRYIKAYHRCYDPLSYPLFFPAAEVGWNRFLPYNGDPLNEHPFADAAEQPDSGRLFHQFVVDVWLKIEGMRLDFFLKEDTQKLIRADVYQGVVDTIAAGSKITGPDQYDAIISAYDAIISAEIPDINMYPELQKLVVKHMLHGPYSPEKRDNPCMLPLHLPNMQIVAFRESDNLEDVVAHHYANYPNIVREVALMDSNYQVAFLHAFDQVADFYQSQLITSETPRGIVVATALEVDKASNCLSTTAATTMLFLNNRDYQRYALLEEVRNSMFKEPVLHDANKVGMNFRKQKLLQMAEQNNAPGEPEVVIVEDAEVVIEPVPKKKCTGNKGFTIPSGVEVIHIPSTP
uniref:Uncharacterized protein n=1 Tax=Oryza meridionalis TaxID=40149 RepID=A0A0E0C2M4_9ORYZ